jgi:hypothetical protein
MNSPVQSLAGVNLSLFDAPAPPPATPDLSALVKIKRASNGAEILLCTVHPAPAAAVAESKRLGLALFTPPEIPFMRQLAEQSPDQLDKMLEIKRVFGGTITSHKDIS